MLKNFRIAILATRNPYNSTPYFAKGLAKALKKLGMTVDLYTFAPDCFYKAHYAMVDSPPDLTLSFSDIRMGNISLGELSHTPHLSCLIDPAIYYRHHFQGKYSLVSTVDRKDLAFIQAQNFSKAFFLPHAVDNKLFEIEPQEKVFDLAMLGTCYDFEKIAATWPRKYSPKTAHLLQDAAEEVLSRQGISVLEALQKRQFDQDLSTLHAEVDLYVEGRERVELLRALKKVDIHIWGKGPWKKYLPQATLHAPSAFQKLPSILARSKIVVSPTPRFKDGSHERVFYGLACSALPLTGKNPFMEENFVDGESILTYLHGEYENIEDRVLELLGNEKKFQSIVESGKKIVATKHTWEQRAHTLVDFLARFVILS